jgi:hypothetical protein
VAELGLLLAAQELSSWLFSLALPLLGFAMVVVSLD